MEDNGSCLYLHIGNIPGEDHTKSHSNFIAILQSIEENIFKTTDDQLHIYKSLVR